MSVKGGVVQDRCLWFPEETNVAVMSQTRFITLHLGMDECDRIHLQAENLPLSVQPLGDAHVSMDTCANVHQAKLSDALRLYIFTLNLCLSSVFAVYSQVYQRS